MIGLSSTVLVTALLVVVGNGQTVPISPCPSVFMYEPPGSEPGRWYGIVTLSTDITLHGLWLNIVLDSKADILGNWVGDVTTTDNINFQIENTKMKIQSGPAQAVKFFVQYNQLNKAPKLSAIRLNGREICNANHPQTSIDGPLDNRPIDEFTPRPSEDRPVTKPSRIDVTSGRPTQSVGRPQETSRPEPSRNQDTRPNIRPEDRPVTRPIQGRPSGDGPVYVPTQVPPIEQSNVNPFSIGSGQPPSQNVGSQNKPGNQNRPILTTVRPKPKPDFSGDYSEDSSPSTDDDYFGGGLPTIVRPLGNNNNRNPPYNNRGEQSQCGKVIRNANPLVVNGRPTLEGQWPWQIALYQTQTVDSKYICGGTLVSHHYVITAAHCVTRKGSSRVVNKNTLTIYLGKHNLRTSTEGVQIKFVGEIIVHPQYNASSFSRDVGILKLRDSAQFSDFVRPACLWPEDQLDLSYIIGKRGSVVGWGFDDKGMATEELTLVEMPVVDQETCIRSYSEFFARFTSEYTYCAGYRDGTSVCNGDSGGGMVFKTDNTWYLRGLVSLSVARQNEYRCDPTHYVVFTDLAKFLTWIKQTMGNDY